MRLDIAKKMLYNFIIILLFGVKSVSNNIKNYKYHLENTYSKAPLKFGSTSLWQIGMLYCKPDTVIASHQHPNLYELTVVTGGRGWVYANGVPAKVRTGDIYLSLPYEYHEIASDSADPLKFDFFAFMTEDAQLLESLEEISKDTCGDARVFRDGEIAPLITEALGELEDQDVYSEKMLNGLLSRILIRVVRAFGEKQRVKRRGNATDAESLCYQVMNYIDTHMFTMSGLPEVTDYMNYNYSYISDLFKRTTGQTLMDYYRIKRLDTARRMLEGGETNITRIAEALNYSSVFTFSRAFKAMYGMSPKQYKKENE